MCAVCDDITSFQSDLIISVVNASALHDGWNEHKQEQHSDLYENH
jgi:hypothetical protein